MAPPPRNDQHPARPPTASDLHQGERYIGRQVITFNDNLGWVFTTDKDGYTLERLPQIDRSHWDSGTPENPAPDTVTQIRALLAGLTKEQKESLLGEGF